MLESAIAPVGALISDHLMLGGLGGVITVIVGGIATVIAWRGSKRAVARPAPNPEAPPAIRRAAPPRGYGESAPPTSPARRLHPGPITMSGVTHPRPEPAPDENASATSLFNPDLLSNNIATEEPPFTAPVWRTNSEIVAELRAQDLPTPDALPLHRPFWTTASLTRASAIPDLTAIPDLADEAPLPFDPSLVIEPPVWSTGFGSARVRLASLSADALGAAEEPMSAPVWPSHGAPHALPEEGSIAADAAANAGEIECEPPLWSSLTDRTP